MSAICVKAITSIITGSFTVLSCEDHACSPCVCMGGDTNLCPKVNLTTTIFTLVSKVANQVDHSRFLVSV